MTLEELHKYYKNWSAISRELKFAATTIKYWRKRGAIPMPSQLLIEYRTGGLFKASEEDAKPKGG